jgi:probable HAF family extracellular repeat protein
VWEPDGATVTELGVPPGFLNSEARAINARGQMVGLAYRARGPDIGARAFLWDAGELIDLGALPDLPESYPVGLNNAGQVVGFSSRGGDAFEDVRAWVWEHGVLHDLNDRLPPDSGWELTSARGINDAGQIVGGGRHHGAQHAFLMTPIRRGPPGRLPRTGTGSGSGQRPSHGVAAGGATRHA